MSFSESRLNPEEKITWSEAIMESHLNPDEKITWSAAILEITVAENLAKEIGGRKCENLDNKRSCSVDRKPFKSSDNRGVALSDNTGGVTVNGNTGFAVSDNAGVTVGGNTGVTVGGITGVTVNGNTGVALNGITGVTVSGNAGVNRQVGVSHTRVPLLQHVNQTDDSIGDKNNRSNISEYEVWDDTTFTWDSAQVSQNQVNKTANGGRHAGSDQSRRRVRNNLSSTSMKRTENPHVVGLHPGVTVRSLLPLVNKLLPDADQECLTVALNQTVLKSQQRARSKSASKDTRANLETIHKVSKENHGAGNLTVPSERGPSRQISSAVVVEADALTQDEIENVYKEELRGR